MRSLIKEIFVDKEEYIIALINKHNLDQPLERLVKVVEARIKNPVNGLDGIPGIFLTTINDNFLACISDGDEKREVEYLIREIAMYLLVKYIQSSNSSKYDITRSLRFELKTACDYHGYNYHELNRVFPIEDLVSFAKDTSKSGDRDNLIVNPPTFYYDWIGNNYDLDTLSRDLKSQNIISGIRNFKGLFTHHTGEIVVRFNRDYLDFIIVLFDRLYKKGLLIPKGINGGKFHPLRLYAVDFEEKSLIEKDPKAIKYRIIKNKSHYKALSDKVERWIKDFKPN